MPLDCFVFYFRIVIRIGFSDKRIVFGKESNSVNEVQLFRSIQFLKKSTQFSDVYIRHLDAHEMSHVPLQEERVSQIIWKINDSESSSLEIIENHAETQ